MILKLDGWRRNRAGMVLSLGALAIFYSECDLAIVNKFSNIDFAIRDNLTS